MSHYLMMFGNFLLIAPLYAFVWLAPARLEELTGPRRASGLLIVLPTADDLATVDAASPQGTAWRALEQWLVTRELQLPVYFAHDDASLQAIRNQLNAERLGALDSGTRYQVVTNGAEANEVTALSGMNFQGSLTGANTGAAAATLTNGEKGPSGAAAAGASSGAAPTAPTDGGEAAVGDSDSLPIVAVVASYDTFAASPTLAVGADQSGNTKFFIHR